MKKRLLGAVAALAGVALTVSAVPAFTADSGTVTVTIAAQAPAVPCIEFATPPGVNVNFGVLPFSRPGLNGASFARGDIVPVWRNCGAESEQVHIHGTDATGASVTWSLSSEPSFLGLHSQ